MTDQAPQSPVLANGPYEGLNSPRRANLRLLALLSPITALLIASAIWGQHTACWSWLLALTGAGMGVLIFSPRPRQTLSDLDWAVTSFLGGIIIGNPLFRNQNLEAIMGLAVGLICGFLAARPGAAYLRGRPGLIVWLAVTITVFAVTMFFLVTGLPDPHFIFKPANGLAILALAAAGFCFAAGRTSVAYWVVPWLAVPLGLALMKFWPDLIGGWTLRSLYEAGPLMLPIFFIAPQMARNWPELLAYEAILLFIWLYPLPSLGLFFDSTLLYSGLIFIPRLLSDLREQRRPLDALDAGPSVETSADNRALIKCGHGGTAPRLAEWRGLSSCLLAAQNDGGPLLCPYGCLGLGDCLRVCPAGAISLGNGFPVIDSGRCRGCGRCWAVCPKQLFELNEGQVRAFIPCASRSGLKSNAQYCEKSCLGCGKCRKACPAKAIGRAGDSGAMAVDQALCRAYGPSCGQACHKVCPRKIIAGLLK